MAVLSSCSDDGEVVDLGEADKLDDATKIFFSDGDSVGSPVSWPAAAAITSAVCTKQPDHAPFPVRQVRGAQGVQAGLRRPLGAGSLPDAAGGLQHHLRLRRRARDWSPLPPA